MWGETEKLKEIFLAEARVLDIKRGYISAASFNLRMKPKILSMAGKLIAKYFENDGIEVIHGVPHSGVYLATAVVMSMKGEVRLHVARKDQLIPLAWKDIGRTEISSHKTVERGNVTIEGISLSFVRPGERVLIVDDVCSTGQTAMALIEMLRQKKSEGNWSGSND